MTACRPLDLANKTDANARDPVGHRAVRDTITSPYGKTAVCGKVVIGADNNCTLFVNSDNIGQHSMKAYSIPDMDPNVNVLTVDGITPRLDVLYRQYLEDGYWATDGFESIGLGDGAWSDASDYGTF
ncbi:hypothetical protein EDD85DRAFT_945999 [Armillaria nabsnona]|nr:hypothetical protein EDD85DRAFT_945999 [Armillaria nabsnona]